MKLLNIPPSYLTEELIDTINSNKSLRNQYYKKYYGGGNTPKCTIKNNMFINGHCAHKDSVKDIWDNHKFIYDGKKNHIRYTFTDNSLTKITSALCNLKDLQLPNNNITIVKDLPVTLQTLDLSNNKINEINISNLKNLEKLNLSNNKINEINIEKLTKLTVLNLNINELNKHISHLNLDKLINLEFLELNSCKLTGNIPTNFKEFTNLKVLDLSNNTLNGGLEQHVNWTEFPTLSTLNVSNNDFTGPLPVSFLYSVSLKDINLLNNNLSSRSDMSDMDYCIRLAVKKITKLNISDNNLTCPIMDNVESTRKKIYCHKDDIGSVVGYYLPSDFILTSQLPTIDKGNGSTGSNYFIEIPNQKITDVHIVMPTRNDTISTNNLYYICSAFKSLILIYYTYDSVTLTWKKHKNIYNICNIYYKTKPTGMIVKKERHSLIIVYNNMSYEGAVDKYKGAIKFEVNDETILTNLVEYIKCMAKHTNINITNISNKYNEEFSKYIGHECSY